MGSKMTQNPMSIDTSDGKNMNGQQGEENFQNKAHIEVPTETTK